MTDLQRLNMQKYLDQRACAYNILRRIFLESPSKELLVVLKNVCLKKSSLIKEHRSIQKGITSLKKLFLKANLDEILSLAQNDYIRLFSKELNQLAPLYESSYPLKENSLFQKNTSYLQNAYVRYRLTPMLLGIDADDHLVMELDFMYRLNNLMVFFNREGNEEKIMNLIRDQIMYLDKHLLQWVPLLKASVLVHAQGEFYKALLYILSGFLEVDRRKLEGFLSNRYLKYYY